MTRDVTYFPIGSMIVLKESNAATMNSGYLAEYDTDPGYIWNYRGFMTPFVLPYET